jgi:hypothetical protein
LAQAPVSDSEDDYSQNAGISRKIDDFGKLGECDRNGRMDNFLIELMNEPESRGYIIFYQAKDVLPGQHRRQAKQFYLDHLKYRRFDESRITLIEAFREKQQTELWIVPPGGKIPEPAYTVEPAEIPKNAAYLYDRKNLEYFFYEYGENEFLLQSVIDKYKRDNEEALAEVPRAEEPIAEQEETAGDKPQTYLEVPEIVPPEEPAAESAAEPEEEDDFGWFNPAFIDKIKDDKDNRGVIVFYADDETFDTGKIRQYLEKAVQKFAEKYEIGAGKLTVVSGGYRPGIVVEMWAVPKNTEMPELKPDERLPDETVTIDN